MSAANLLKWHRTKSSAKVYCKIAIFGKIKSWNFFLGINSCSSKIPFMT